MPTIAISSKAGNYNINVFDLKLTSILDNKYDREINFDKRGNIDVTLTDRKTGDYLHLEGEFNVKASNIANAVDTITSISAGEGNKISYTISGLDLHGNDLKTDKAFATYIDSQAYKIAGNNSANAIASAGGNDSLYGNGGNDLLSGLDGNDKLFGGVGDDRLFGGYKNDQLSGDAGRDRLDGGDGNDTLKGGADIDTFVFKKGSDIDTIVDFDASGKDHDILDLSSFTKLHDFSDISFIRHKHDLVIDFGNDEIVLQDVTLKDFDKSDFHL